MSGMRGAADRFSEALESLQQENHEAAVSLLIEAIALDPEMAQAYRARATAFTTLKKLDEARVDLAGINSIEDAALCPPESH